MTSTPAFTNYSGMVMAAPMVRISVLGFRTFAARCGSDVVFSEELVAAKLVKCVRESRPVPPWMLGPGPLEAPATEWDAPFDTFISLPEGSELVEFVHYEPWGKGGQFKRAVVFSTLRVPSEHRSRIPYPEGRPVILQMGVADPDIGAKAAALLMNDVDGFDLNMGCPKKFSVSNGMGASLMAEPARAASILSAIRQAIGPVKPLSFKTRVFEDVEQSIEQLRTCIQTGAIHSVTLHARFRSQRSETKPQLDTASHVARRIKELFPHIAVIYNGSLGCSGLDGGGDVGAPPGEAWNGRTSILQVVREMGFDGGLIARDAMWNPTVMLADGGYSPNYVAVHRRLLEYHASCGTSMAFLKYHITRTFGQGSLQNEDKDRYKKLLNAKNVVDFGAAFGMDAKFAATLMERQKWFGDESAAEGGAELDALSVPNSTAASKRDRSELPSVNAGAVDETVDQPVRSQPSAEPCAA